jgi:predicted ATPase/DNA-binding SARP family transcriptional activator
MQKVQLFLFGPPRMLCDGADVKFRTSKAIALFAYLALTRRSQPREVLAALLWPQLDQKRAHSALRTTLWKIRKTAPGGWLKIHRDYIQLDHSSDFWVDAWEFLDTYESTGANSIGCPHDQQTPCQECVIRLSQAVSVINDSLMSGFSLRDSVSFDNWQVTITEDISRDFEGAFFKLAISCKKQNQFHQSIIYARRLIAANPYNEEGHRLLIEMYYQTGQRSAAIKQYQECSKIITEKTGTDLQPETIQLFTKIQREALTLKEDVPTSISLILLLLGLHPINFSPLTEDVPFLLELREFINRCGGRQVKVMDDGYAILFDGDDIIQTAIALQGILDSQPRHTETGLMRIIILPFQEAQTKLESMEKAEKIARSLLEAEWENRILLTAEALEIIKIPPGTAIKNLGLQYLPLQNDPLQIYGLWRSGLQGLKPTYPILGELMTQKLPSYPTPFIGRTHELLEIGKLLADPDCRLITLCGPGGIGKTRLAVEAAARNLHQFSHRVHFISLASIDDPELIVSNLASALQFTFFSSKSSHEENKQQLFRFLREKQMLIILDNFEHLLQENKLVADILTYTAKIKILVTSREPLNLQGEWAYPLEGMEYPEGNDLTEPTSFSSVQLFIYGAHKARPGHPVGKEEIPPIIKICQMLHGLPLGLELAAGQVAESSCEEIVKEIQTNLDFLVSKWGDLPERQRSLRAIFDVTYENLNAREQTALKALSVFRGGISPLIAERLIKPTFPIFAKLARKALLRKSTEGHYEMQEAFRLYCASRLAESPEEEKTNRDLHCRAYADYLHHRTQPLTGHGQAKALEEIEREIENIRAAWNYAVLHSRLQDIDSMVESFHHFFNIKGLFKEGEAAFGKAADMLMEGKEQVQELEKGTALLLGKLLIRQAWHCRRFGQYARAEQLLEKIFPIAIKWEDHALLGRCYLAKGNTEVSKGHFEKCRSLYLKGLAIFKELNQRREIGAVLLNLGNIAEDRAESLNLYHQSLELFREVGDRWAIMNCLHNLGRIALMENQPEEAIIISEETFIIAKELGDQRGISLSFSKLGSAKKMLGDYPEAVRCFQRSLSIALEMGEHYDVLNNLYRLGELSLLMGDYHAARGHFRQALQRISPYDEVFSGEIASILSGTAALFDKEGHIEQALEILGFLMKHDIAWHEVRDEMMLVSGSLKSKVSADDYLRIQERSAQKDLNELISELLAIL